MISTAVRRAYGFEYMQVRAASVDAALLEIQRIQEAIADLASIEDNSLSARFGIQMQADSSSDGSDE